MQATLKFSDQELDAIKTLQGKFQEKMIFFGQIAIQRLNLEETETRLKHEYVALQKQEEDLLTQLTKKYGEGNLNIKDGTFTPKS